MNVTSEITARLHCYLSNKPYITYHKSNVENVTSSGYLKRIQKRRVENVRVNDSVFYEDETVLSNVKFIKSCKKYITGLKGKIIDVGCASGDYYRIFKIFKLPFSNLKYTGIDISGEDIETACIKYPEAKFLKLDLKNMKNIRGKYEVIFCSGTLQYLNKDYFDVLNAFGKISNKYIFITRLPLTNESTTYACQRVFYRGGLEVRNLLILNLMEFEAYIKSFGFTIIKKSKNNSYFNVRGMRDNVYHYN